MLSRAGRRAVVLRETVLEQKGLRNQKIRRRGRDGKMTRSSSPEQNTARNSLTRESEEHIKLITTDDRPTLFRSLDRYACNISAFSTRSWWIVQLKI